MLLLNHCKKTYSIVTRFGSSNVCKKKKKYNIYKNIYLTRSKLTENNSTLMRSFFSFIRTAIDGIQIGFFLNHVGTLVYVGIKTQVY